MSILKKLLRVAAPSAILMIAAVGVETPAFSYHQGVHASQHLSQASRERGVRSIEESCSLCSVLRAPSHQAIALPEITQIKVAQPLEAFRTLTDVIPERVGPLLSRGPPPLVSPLKPTQFC